MLQAASTPRRHRRVFVKSACQSICFHSSQNLRWSRRAQRAARWQYGVFDVEPASHPLLLLKRRIELEQTSAASSFYTALGGKKLVRFQQFAALYPEAVFVFCGDDGQVRKSIHDQECQTKERQTLQQ